jgi:hypothetical protein
LDAALNLLPYAASASSFSKFIVNSKDSKLKLAEEIKNCGIDSLKIRFNVWRMLIGVCSINGNL